MNRIVAYCVVLLFNAHIFGQDIANVDLSSFAIGNKKFTYNLDVNALKSKLDANSNNVAIVLKDENGNDLQLLASYVPLMDKSYEDLYEIRSFRLKSADRHTFTSGRLCITPKGISAVIIKDGHNVFIESDANGKTSSYLYIKNNDGEKHCGTDDSHEDGDRSHQKIGASRTGESLKTFKIAVAATGEFSNKRSNNLATINADIATYLSAVNAIYEVEISVNFILAVNNNNIIFFDPVTDGLDPSNPISTAQTVIGNAMPTATYNLGHVLHEITVSSGYTYSGIAGVGVVCSTTGFNKASGWTGIGGAYNLAIVMEVWLHEIGHQFGANHTFYGTAGNCAGSQRSANHGYEPGSGNTIMSYEGTCSSASPCTNQNITPYVNSFYFNAHSTEQMVAKIASVSCFTSQATGNNDPVANVGAAISVPKSTPFILSGTATDANGDPLTYDWEEYDTDNLSLSCPAGAPNDAANSTTAPCFRSFDPGTTKNSRSFPRESDVIANTQTMGEIMPAVARTMKFRMSVRDGNGGIGYAEKTVNIINTAGGFAITNLNTATTIAGGASTAVTWSVNGTTAAPISCANVKISFSNDGGITFPITLSASTANDGTENVVIPNFATTRGRIKVEAVGNVFYDINNANITVTSACNPGTSDIINADSIIANPGEAILDLSPVKGLIYNSIDGVLETTDPATNIVGKNLSNANSCITFGLSKNYDLVTFKASKTGSYTFILNATYVSVINLYNTSYSTSNGCTNWFNSSMEATNTSGSNYSLSFLSSLTVSLTAGNTYVMQITNYNGLGAYSITYSNAQNGKLYTDTNVPPAGYSYTYVIENKANGNVIAIDASANLSSAATFPTGDYRVWGLAFTTGANLTSYVGGTLTTLQNATYAGSFCGFLSNNFIPVKINACVPGTKTVTSSADTNTPGTLRYILANVCPGDLIVFDAALTGINLTSAIVIDKPNAVVNGPGKTFVLSGSNTNRIFDINPGITFEIRNIALKNGLATTNGGAFYNQGTVTLDNVLLQNNKQATTPKAYSSTGTVIVKGATDVKL